MVEHILNDFPALVWETVALFSINFYLFLKIFYEKYFKCFSIFTITSFPTKHLRNIPLNPLS